MKYLLLLLSLIMVSCGSTKNINKSSNIVDSTSITKTKIDNTIVQNNNIIDTTSTVKKDTTIIANNIIINKSTINIKPHDTTKPLIVEDNKGNKYTVTNGSIDINNESKQDLTKTFASSNTIHKGKYSDTSVTSNTSKGTIKSKTNLNTTNTSVDRFKRNWSYFPVFLLLVIIIGLNLWIFLPRIWKAFKTYILKL